MRLTSKAVAALTLPPGKQDHIEFDDAVPGFGIRLRASGSRTWLFQYRIGAKQRRMALGSVSAIPVGAARETAGKLHCRILQLGNQRGIPVARGQSGSEHQQERREDARARSQARGAADNLECLPG